MPQIDFVTLFPEMIGQALSHSMMLRAQERGAVQFRTSSPRDYCYDRHGKVDDVPFGGEPGMLMRAEPVALAVELWASTPAGTESPSSRPTPLGGASIRPLRVSFQRWTRWCSYAATTKASISG
jgi:tRNA (guanine37-N1)-methyltransferase